MGTTYSDYLETRRRIEEGDLEELAGAQNPDVPDVGEPGGPGGPDGPDGEGPDSGDGEDPNDSPEDGPGPGAPDDGADGPDGDSPDGHPSDGQPPDWDDSQEPPDEPPDAPPEPPEPEPEPEQHPDTFGGPTRAQIASHIEPARQAAIDAMLAASRRIQTVLSRRRGGTRAQRRERATVTAAIEAAARTALMRRPEWTTPTLRTDGATIVSVLEQAVDVLRNATVIPIATADDPGRYARTARTAVHLIQSLRNGSYAHYEDPGTIYLLPPFVDYASAGDRAAVLVHESTHGVRSPADSDDRIEHGADGPLDSAFFYQDLVVRLAPLTTTGPFVPEE